MSKEENKTIVRRFFEEGPSKGDLVAANELYLPTSPCIRPFLLPQAYKA